MVIVSCQERAFRLAETLASLKASDWTGDIQVVLDLEQAAKPSTGRIRATWKRAVEIPADVWCEDDLTFGAHFQRNLEAHRAIQGPLYYTALYHPDFDNREVYGCQAITMSPAARVIILANWRDDAPADIEMPRCVKRHGGAVGYHRPSLVEHVGTSTYGGPVHRALDFDADWRAS